MEGRRHALGGLFFVSALATGLMGANCVRMQVDYVRVTMNTEGTGMRISAVFPKDNLAELAANLELSDHGSAFVLPHSSVASLEIGFDLKTTIFSDPAYTGLLPREKLPNGMVMPNLKPMVEFENPAQAPDLGLYVYVDMEDQEWIGATGVFKKALDQNFPPGVVLTQYYNRDEAGTPMIIVMVHGASVKIKNGVKVSQGSMSVFANIKALMGSGDFAPGKEVILHKEKEFYSAPAPSVTPTPTPAAVYTVVRGQRVEQNCSVPCTLEFDITNFEHTAGDDLLEEHLAWSVTEGGDWNGGNPSAGTYSAAFKDYKLKVYAIAAFAGERRISVRFEKTQTYHIKCDVGTERTTLTVQQNGHTLASVSVDAEAPSRVAMGYGWPPSKRNGAEGARLSNIRLGQ